MYFNTKLNKVLYLILFLLNIPFILFFIFLMKEGVNFVVDNGFIIISIGFNIFLFIVILLQHTKLNKTNLNLLAILFSCHVNPSRTFSIFKKKFYICSRCTGILFGMLVSTVFGFFNIHLIIYILMLLPLIVDGAIQHKTSYESNNTLRFFTGLLFGVSVVYFYSVIIIGILKLAILFKMIIN